MMKKNVDSAIISNFFFIREQYEKIKEDIILQNEERLSTLEMEKDHVSHNLFLEV